MGKPWGGVVCPPFFLPEGLNLLSLEYWRVIDSRARRTETVSPAMLCSFGENSPAFTVDLKYECCSPELCF